MDDVPYAGGIQLNTAAVDDRLDALVPRWAWHDLPLALAPNGVTEAGWDTLLLAVGTTGARRHRRGRHAQEEDVVDGLDHEVYEANLLGAATNAFPEESVDYYCERSPNTKLDGIETPTLLVSGWPDALFVPNEAVWTFDGRRDAPADAGDGRRRLLQQPGVRRRVRPPRPRRVDGDAAGRGAPPTLPR